MHVSEMFAWAELLKSAKKLAASVRPMLILDYDLERAWDADVTRLEAAIEVVEREACLTTATATDRSSRRPTVSGTT